MPEVICQKIERIGCITLNRPEALNALTYGMISEIEETLELWRNDNSVSLVILDATGDRAFCSGGDIADL
ncbi:MAG: enoyl-CoA hydratase, partial [Rhodobacteraceae bacterium]|nr:enoyl-CoA hydratase [Paracoccaceae bacterium]